MCIVDTYEGRRFRVAVCGASCEVDDVGALDDVLEDVADDGDGSVGFEEAAEGAGVDACFDLREKLGLDVIQGVGEEGSEYGGIGPASCAAAIYDSIWSALHDGNGAARSDCVVSRRLRDCGGEARQKEGRQYKVA